MHVKHNWTSPNPEWWIEYNARQSAPKNRAKMETGELTPGQLLAKCLGEPHWSPFEHAAMSIEVTTSMPVCVQILRHGKGFGFQQFSQRYSDPLRVGLDFEPMELRFQSVNARQGSSDDEFPDELDVELQAAIAELQEHSRTLYRKLIDKGVAREVAREVLLQGIQTRFTMTGWVRSFITYLRTRLAPSTQREHRRVAQAIAAICARELPVIGQVEGWVA